MKEFKALDIIKSTISDSSYIGDDTAFIGNLCITQDTLIEDIHFRQKTISPYELGQKAIAVNLSDLAAAGAIPKYLLISLSMPASTSETFVKDFYLGVEKLCKTYAVKVIGGDITGSEKIAITITAIGETSKQIKRSYAKENDIICVTGEHGNSRAGLEILEKNLASNPKFELAHKVPTPKIKEGQIISTYCQNPAIMDTSDGLADALFKIAEASNLTLSVDFDKIPFDKNLKEIAQDNFKNWILFGGEDYELLCCISKTEFDLLKEKIQLYPIGTVIPMSDAPVKITIEGSELNIDKTAIENMSFNHFSGEKK